MKMLVTILKKRLGQKSLISKKATVSQLGISSFFVTENFLSQTPFLIGLFIFQEKSHYSNLDRKFRKFVIFT